MSTVSVIFTTSNLPGAVLIRWVTWSEWSHVAIIDEDRQEVIEAVWPTVRAVPLAHFLAKHPRHHICRFSATNPRAVIAAARSQIGKPYDLWGMIGLGLRRDWQDDSAWWCSENVPWCFGMGGNPMFRPKALRRITPQHIWMLAPAEDAA